MIWGYIVLAYLSLFALGIGDNIRGPLYPEILKAFQVSDTHGAIFYAASSFCGFLASLSVRFLLQHWSRVHTLQVAIFMMAVGLIGMGSVDQFNWLLVFSGILGASLGVIGVVQNVLVSVGSSPKRRQQMLAGLHANYGVSSVIAPLVVAGVTTLLGSWRYVFWVVAAVPLSLLAGSLLWKDRGANGEQTSSPLTPPIPQSRRDHGGQIFLAVSLALYVMAEIMVSSRLPLFVRRELQLDLEDSSFYLTGFFLCLLLGRLLFTFVHFKWPVRRMLVFFLASSAVCCALGLLGHPVFLVVSGLFMAPFYPLAMLYISSHYEKNMDSAVSYTMATQSFCLVIMHGLVGYLTDGFGISMALWVGPLALVLSCVLLLSFERLFRKTA